MNKLISIAQAVKMNFEPIISFRKILNILIGKDQYLRVE